MVLPVKKVFGFNGNNEIWFAEDEEEAKRKLIEFDTFMREVQLNKSLIQIEPVSKKSPTGAAAATATMVGGRLNGGVARLTLDKVWQEVQRLKRCKVENSEFYKFQRMITHPKEARMERVQSESKLK